VEAKLVRNILFIVIKQCLIWFLKYVLKVGSETVGFNCEKIRVGVFLCRTMNTVVLGVFLSQRKPLPAGTSRGTCWAQNSYKRK